MFIGGLNWETTDRKLHHLPPQIPSSNITPRLESLKDYFTQFGEVTECTVMRDGVTGRSRGFGFLTFKDPKVVNVVMVKEHLLDGKLVSVQQRLPYPHNVILTQTQIDPKRAIPRDEQEKTSKIFVGGVSQEATETDFRQFFAQFGNVLDCTLMMDKDTGRPRGFGFVTFDDDNAVERALSQPLAIHGKPIEVKRAEPRGNLREEGGGGRGGGRFGGAGRGGGQQANFGVQQDQAAQAAGANNISQAMMGQYMARMQQMFVMMQNNMAGSGGMPGGMNPMAAMQQNPQMMQQMMANMGRGQGGGNGGMSPQMMQQMGQQMPQQMQQQMPQQMQGGYPGGMSGSVSPGPGAGGQGMQAGYNAQEQMQFEQQKYERQQMARMQGQNFNGGNAWDGMYDDVPAPAGMNNNNRGGFAGRGGGGGRGGAAGGGPQRGGSGTPGNAPANAPTGPKNAGMPGSNYRGGGRGGRGGGRFDPYGRNNAK